VPGRQGADRFRIGEQHALHPFAIRNVCASNDDRVNVHVNVDRQVYLTPRCFHRRFTVFLLVPLAGPAETHPRAVDNKAHVLAIG
jgi:hypothetical protein